jgi:hypothetical protein
MSRTFVLFILLAAFVSPIVCDAKGNGPLQTDAEVKKEVIAESIAAYPGKCSCPYNVARNGSACGGRSAWSKQGGYSPICYEREVTAEMISKWRTANGESGSSLPTKK